MKLAILERVKELYEKENQNIIEYLKSISNKNENELEDILISYDFQAGTYTRAYEAFPTLREASAEKIAQYINKLTPVSSLLDVGVGEATTLGLVLKKMSSVPKVVKGVDLSWSRIKFANQFLSKKDINFADLVVGDMFELPLMDNSIDLVFTFQALEPNGGKEKEALQELYRISKKYLVLVEPCYEIANEASKQRMDKNGYIKDLYHTAKELGYNILVHEPLGINLNEMNPVTILIIEKSVPVSEKNDNQWCCSLTKTPLQEIDGCLYSEKSLLAYPIINDIPCLLPSNAIVATKMLID